MIRKRSDPNLQMPMSFLDVLLNTLLVLIMVFYMAPMNEEQQKKKTNDKESIDRFRITLTWDDTLADDVDLWVADPVGNLVFYRRREQGLMHLDRDDLGKSNDTMVLQSGETITFPHNEESVLLRGITEGEYTVNVHLYRLNSGHPIEATVTIYDLGGSDHTVLTKKVTLEHGGDERTVFRFTLDAQGTMSNINDLPRNMAQEFLREEAERSNQLDNPLIPPMMD